MVEQHYGARYRKCEDILEDFENGFVRARPPFLAWDSSIDETYEWAKKVIAPEYALKLKEEKCDAEVLFHFTKMDFMSCGIPEEPSAKLLWEIQYSS